LLTELANVLVATHGGKTKLDALAEWQLKPKAD
jgi:hypothetical protein